MMGNHHTLTDVEKTLALKSWWAALFVLPLANRTVLLIANRTKMTPNQITFVACLWRLAAAVFFLNGSYVFLVSGAACYYFAYLADCVDGPVARLTRNFSEFGRYFDHLSDLMGDMLILICLAHGQHILTSPIVLAMGFIHLVEYYISYLTSNLLIKNKISAPKAHGSRLVNLLQRYRFFFFSRNYKSFLSFPDYEAWIFIVFPVLGQPIIGLETGFYLLLLVVGYTIFSSFLSINFGGGKFP
jgi:phosphatidylglycerophosphate synthase